MDDDSDAKSLRATSCLLGRAIDRGYLPVLSESHALVSALLEGSQAELYRAAELTAQDPALCVNVLRFAAQHEPGLHKSRVEQVALQLGRGGLCAMLAECEVVRGLGFPGRLDLQQLRDHAVNVALVARFHARANASDSDVAYLAGLLHDVGILALARHMPATMHTLLHSLQSHHSLQEACTAQAISNPLEWSVALLEGLEIAESAVPVLSALASLEPWDTDLDLQPLQRALRRSHQLCEQQRCAPHWDQLPAGPRLGGGDPCSLPPDRGLDLENPHSLH